MVKEGELQMLGRTFAFTLLTKLKYFNLVPKIQKRGTNRDETLYLVTSFLFGPCILFNSILHT